MSLFLTSFIFEKKEYDEEFYQLDGWIERYTQSIDGYIGMESYTDAASGRIVNNYYWQTRESMELLINNLQHQQAKSQSHKWLSGYQTIIAENMDCIVVKVRQNGSVINKAVFLALGINTEGQKELLGMWQAENEGAIKGHQPPS